MFHEDNSWLNTEAPLNMPDIVVDAAVFHVDSGWLKARA